jgi:hypothetical protein
MRSPGRELEVVVKTDLSEADLIKMIPEFSAPVVRPDQGDCSVIEAARNSE